jgi:hypothetical protein
LLQYQTNQSPEQHLLMQNDPLLTAGNDPRETCNELNVFAIALHSVRSF